MRLTGSPKLLMLGASDLQVHAISAAVALGAEVITTDDRPENPGHAIAHQYHAVSTTDLDGVLGLARRLQVDGILAYASDPAAFTAAHVADHLGLPGDPVIAVRVAQDKLAFRAAQREAGLPTPDFTEVTGPEDIAAHLRHHPDGVLTKPIDSSGSRGVTVLGRDSAPGLHRMALEKARSASNVGRVLAEEFWGESQQQIGADALVLNGIVSQLCLYRQTASSVREAHAPVGALAPLLDTSWPQDEAARQMQTLVSAIGLRSGIYNAEFRIDADGRLTIIDFGARIGGNLLGIVHRAAYGIDLVESCIRIALGADVAAPVPRTQESHAGYLVLHASRAGRLTSLALSDAAEPLVVARTAFARPGDPVRPYRTSVDRLGVVVLADVERATLEAFSADPTLAFTVEVDESGPPKIA